MSSMRGVMKPSFSAIEILDETLDGHLQGNPGIDLFLQLFLGELLKVRGKLPTFDLSEISFS